MNKYQTEYSKEYLESLPKEVQEQYYDFITNVPYISTLLSDNRKYAKDLPRDNEGKIIIDITEPHILEDTDYFRPSAIHYQQYGCFTKLKPNANPNSEYGKWIREEVRRCWEGYVRPSDGEWITGDMYFFLNYCPIQLIKKDSNGKSIRTIDFPRFWDGHYYKFHYLNQCRSEGHHAAELASRGKGKAHPYSQKILTPFGWKYWGDIQIGDYIYGDNGELTKVVDIPYDEVSDIYTVTLLDGRKVQCTDGHLFKVKNHKTKRIEIKPLIEIIKDYKSTRKVSNKNPNGIEYNYRIPKITNAVYFPSKRVPIDPYTLGLLLGDGCFRVTSAKNYVLFTCAKEDYYTYEENIPYKIDKVTNDNYTHAIRFSVEPLINYKLYGLKSEHKFIPRDYLINDRNVRLEILRGLMDSDGTVDKTSGIPVFSTTSEKLKDDFIFLCRSLGYNVSCSLHDSKFNNITYKSHYRIRVITNDSIFKLGRKLKLLNNFTSSYAKSKRDYTSIIDIQYSHKEQAKCITVNNESHCYIIGDFVVTHNSFSAAAMLAKRFILGESNDVKKKVQCVATASERKYIQGANQLLDMFQYYIDFCANNTEFPRQRITSSLQNLAWTMGYVDSETNTRRGTENSVIGITSKDDESKLRGSRGVLYLLEEAGSFPRLLNLYQVLRPSVEDGNSVWGLIYLYGTAGDSDSDFSSMQELMYNPNGYNIKAVNNVYDKEGQGRKNFTYFFPGYMNRADCYDKDGNSDVNKALLEILLDRYKVKYNSTDINAITKRIAEIPITPQEAILKTKDNIFPIAEITKRLNEIDNNPNFFDDVYIGELAFSKQGKIEFTPTTDIPIRDFPTKDNKVQGALEIYEMPQEVHGKVPNERYILSLDNFENDTAQSMSLGSIFVLDLWTDRIVAEYTGRPMFVDDLNEICRKLCLFYNGKVMVENNKKNTFAYFSKMNSLHLMADTPEYLKNRQILKASTFGNASKGCPATVPVTNFAMERLRDWLLKPVTIVEEIKGEAISSTIPNLHLIKNRALLKELMLYNPAINVDRIMSLCQLMIYREEKMIIYQGDPRKAEKRINSSYLGNDPFFNKNYNSKFSKI